MHSTIFSFYYPLIFLTWKCFSLKTDSRICRNQIDRVFGTRIIRIVWSCKDLFAILRDIRVTVFCFNNKSLPFTILLYYLFALSYICINRSPKFFPYEKWYSRSLPCGFPDPAPSPDAVPQESTTAKKHEFWHRISVGGNLGFQVGSITGIVLSPEAKIRVVDQLHLGVGFNYMYIKYKDYYYDLQTKEYLDFKSNVYGGRFFVRYYLASLFDNALENYYSDM